MWFGGVDYWTDDGIVPTTTRTTSLRCGLASG
jgi:hypothetical protein